MQSLQRQTISLEQWKKVYLVIGHASKVITNSSAKIPSYLLTLNFGDSLNRANEKISKKVQYMSSAQLCSNHKAEEIEGRQLMCAINFPRKQIGKIMSDCLTIGAQLEEGEPEVKRNTTVFIKPSHPVDVGSRIDLFARQEIVESNCRDLSWSEFSSLELRIGTIESYSLEEQSETKKTIKLRVNLGLQGTKLGIGLLNQTFEESYLENKQVMVLTNLNRSEIEEHFHDTEAEVLLCTVGGEAVLEPALKIPDGYKIA